VRWMLLLTPVAMAAGCLREIPRGPYLGDCADTPEGAYSWGDIGIGRCLAGPVDLRFVEQGDRTLLLVSNANPYRNFEEGSVLIIDYDSVDLSSDTNLMHEVESWALPLLDDDDGDGIGENPFLGQIGVLPGDQLLVPSRFTEDGVAAPSAQNELRAGRDHVYVIDMSDLDTFASQTPEELRLRDDPMPVVVDEEGGLAYVGNLTDHSLSVLAIDPVERIDVAPGSRLGSREFLDLDGSGSLAELADSQIVLPRDVPDDAWTLTFIDGTTRLYTPTEAGLVRHESSGDGDYREVGFGPELNGVGGALALDPFMYEQAIYEDTEPLAFALFAETVLPDEASDGGAGIRRAQPDGYTAAGWLLESEPVLLGNPGGFDSILGGPAQVGVDGLSELFYDGRESFEGPACIFRARSEDGISYQRVDPGPLFGAAACGDGEVASAYDELAQPFVAFDPIAGRYRMWMSAREEGRWVVALSESDDGLAWGEPQTVLSLPGGDIGGPALRYMNGRYLLAASRAGADGWATVEAESADGVHFTEPFEVVGPTDAPDLGRPVRPGLLTEPSAAWRIEGRDFGQADLPAVAGTGTLNVLPGFAIAVTHGHQVSNSEVPARWAANGLVPGSVVELDGVPTLYATATGGGGLDHVVALQDRGDGWEIVEPFDAIDDALADAGRQALSPVVVEDDDGFVMFYAHVANGVARIRRATSDDGLSWTAERRDLLSDDQDWDAQTQLPHSVEVDDNGRVTLWFSGDSSSRFLIGAASGASLRGSLARLEGRFDPWLFSTGTPGSFDDSGVRDPLVLTIDGVRHLYYAGFDGTTWSLGYAVEGPGGEFERRIGLDDLSLPAMRPLPGSFSGQGVTSPTLLADDGGLVGAPDTLQLLFAGDDGFADRIGAAAVVPEAPEAVFYDGRRATTGDALGFDSTRGGGGISVIELAQEVDDFISDGIGMSSLTLDEQRGMIYVTSKLTPGLFAVDIRDDSRGTFVDANVLDIETVIRPLGGSAGQGFTSSLLSPSRGLLYATAKNPDGLWVFDLDSVVDNDRKDDIYGADRAVLPLPDLSEDAGDRTASAIGGAGMALTDDERILLVTHFRDNSLFAFDLELGDFGEPVGYVPFIGENPHIVRIAPDGMTAVVANYVGDVQGDFASSTLAVIDLDPQSDTYLEPLTWIANL